MLQLHVGCRAKVRFLSGKLRIGKITMRVGSRYVLKPDFAKAIVLQPEDEVLEVADVLYD